MPIRPEHRVETVEPLKFESYHRHKYHITRSTPNLNLSSQITKLS